MSSQIKNLSSEIEKIKSQLANTEDIKTYIAFSQNDGPLTLAPGNCANIKNNNLYIYYGSKAPIIKCNLKNLCLGANLNWILSETDAEKVNFNVLNLEGYQEVTSNEELFEKYLWKGEDSTKLYLVYAAGACVYIGVEVVDYNGYRMLRLRKIAKSRTELVGEEPGIFLLEDHEDIKDIKLEKVYSSSVKILDKNDNTFSVNSTYVRSSDTFTTSKKWKWW